MPPAFLRSIWQRGKLFAYATFWVASIRIFVNDNIADVNSITGTSMAPSLSPDYHETGREDQVFWNKWAPHRNIQRGHIIQFMNPRKPDAFAVKRVIALEGDTVVLDKRRRPENAEGPEPPAAKAWDAWGGKAMVPEGHVWVEGDNHRKSVDSNWYGPVSKSLVTGKASAVVWPPERFWTTPWTDFKNKTKVIEGKVEREWTEGLPVELAEVAEPHLR